MTTEKTVSARLVGREAGTNWYLAYRQRVRAGTDAWVIVGDLALIEAPIRQLGLGTVQVVDADGKSVAGAIVRASPAHPATGDSLQADADSGALITAEFAMEQGREQQARQRAARRGARVPFAGRLLPTTVLSASIRRDVSPPEAMRTSGLSGSPTLGAMRKATRSRPLASKA